MVLGLILGWSIFSRPLQARFGWEPTQLSLVFQCSMIAFCVSAIIGSSLIKKISVRLTIIVSAILLFLGFVLTALFAHYGIWAVFLFYAGFGGFGCGIGYNAIISMVNSWFPDSVGMSSGVQMMGFGLGSLIIGTPSSSIMTSYGFEPVFFAIATVGLIGVILVAVFIKPAPQNIVELIDKNLKGNSATAGQAGVNAHKHRGEKDKILKTPIFYIYSIWATIMVACGYSLISSTSQGAELVGIDAGLAVLLVGLVSSMNGISRMLNGVMFDKFGLVKTMTLNVTVALIATAGLSIAFVCSPSTPSNVLYIIMALFLGYANGSAPVLGSAFVRERFGAAGFAKNLSFININVATGAFLSSFIVSVSGGLSGLSLIYFILSLLTIIAIVAMLVFYRYYKIFLKSNDSDVVSL